MLSRIAFRFQPLLRFTIYPSSKAMYSSSSSSSGSEGSVRSAGGSFAKKEAAQEDQYIRKVNAEKLEHLKEILDKQYHHQGEAKKDEKKKSSD